MRARLLALRRRITGSLWWTEMGWGYGGGLLALGLILAGVTLPFPVMPPGFRPTPQNDPLWMWPFVWVAFAAPMAGLVWLRRISWPVTLLAGWIVLMTWWWGWQSWGVWALLQTAGGLVIYGIAAKLPARADSKLALLVVVAAGLQALHGLVEMAGWAIWMHGRPAHLVGLPMGLLYHPNYFGLFCAMALPVGFALLAHYAMWPRRAALLMPALTLIGIMPMLARSRAGIAGLAPTVAWSMIAAWGVVPSRARRWVLYPLLGTVVIGLAALAITIKPVQLRDLGGRMPVWTVAAVEMDEWRLDGRQRGGWRGGLLIGAGPGTWKTWALWPGGRLRSKGVPELGIREQNAFAGWWQEAMNEWLQATFELGLVGLGLALVCAWRVIRDIGWATGGPRVIECDYGRYSEDVTPFARGWACVAIIALLTAAVAPLFHHAALATMVLIAAGRLRYYRRFAEPPMTRAGSGRSRPAQ